ncbi:shikimate dehydrogenase [Streptomyces sp. NPDC048416]|uniref:shikimate dehydrogenase n=1 Tax=Streptomyces sp. NPDC048416 TaxID=3365546 RepID=UPI00371A2412
MPSPASEGARRAAVLGSPIAHSLSPVLHRAAYAELGLGHWSYDRFEVDEAGLPGFVAGLDASWAGLSLTMPLKRAIIPLLDAVSATAASVEAVNTVVFTDDGRRLGDNTDIPGMIAALGERGVTRVESAAVLGAGATASSALAALARICTGPVTAYVRSEARAAEMRGWGERLEVDVRTVDWSRAAEAFDAPLVVATTPAGTTDALAPAVPERPGTLFDVLYEPWPTALAAAWSGRAGAVVGGLDLLVHQAVLQVEQMTGCVSAPLEAMRKAGEAALAGR